MKYNRRNFLKSASIASVGTFALNSCNTSTANQSVEYSKLDEIIKAPVLKKELFPDPIIIETLELLRFENNFLCRVRSKDGAIGISVGNNDQLKSLYPIFTYRLQPFFIDKDARDWEELLEEVYVFQSNYKLQNLALWVPLATIEFAVLDMLGRIAEKSISELVGEIYNSKISVYQANGDRGITAKETIIRIKKQLEESKAKAIKFKVGGRMSNNFESPAGRTEVFLLSVKPLVMK